MRLPHTRLAALRDAVEPYLEGDEDENDQTNKMQTPDPKVGESYEVNRDGDLYMDARARPFIERRCKVLKQTKGGAWLVEHPENGTTISLAKRNLNIEP